MEVTSLILLINILLFYKNLSKPKRLYNGTILTLSLIAFAKLTKSEIKIYINIPYFTFRWVSKILSSSHCSQGDIIWHWTRSNQVWGWVCSSNLGFGTAMRTKSSLSQVQKKSLLFMNSNELLNIFFGVGGYFYSR